MSTTFLKPIRLLESSTWEGQLLSLTSLIPFNISPRNSDSAVAQSTLLFPRLAHHQRNVSEILSTMQYCHITHEGSKSDIKFSATPNSKCDSRSIFSVLDVAVSSTKHIRSILNTHSIGVHEHQFLTHPHETLVSLLQVEETITDGSPNIPSPNYFHAIRDHPTLRKGDISQSFSAMLCKTGHSKHLTNLHKDIGAKLMEATGELMTTQLVGAVGSYIKSLIFDPIAGGMIGGLMSILLDVFMRSIVASVTAQIAGPMRAEVTQTGATMLIAALPPVLGMLLSGSLSVRLVKALVGSLAFAVNTFLNEQVAGAISGTIIHSLSHTITNSISNGLNYGLTHSLTHTLTTSLSHSVTHYFYCTYCYYFGDYCNYCYYYQDFKWMHK